MRDYARKATPQTGLLKKNSFAWTKELDQAFEQVKLALSSPRVLALPDFLKPLTLVTDASGSGIGAVLVQDTHPEAYFSKVLGVRAQLKSAYERGLIAIVLSVIHWKHYLIFYRFLILTDQFILKLLNDQSEIPPQFHR